MFELWLQKYLFREIIPAGVFIVIVWGREKQNIDYYIYSVELFMYREYLNLFYFSYENFLLFFMCRFLQVFTDLQGSICFLNHLISSFLWIYFPFKYDTVSNVKIHLEPFENPLDLPFGHACLIHSYLLPIWAILVSCRYLYLFLQFLWSNFQSFWWKLSILTHFTFQKALHCHLHAECFLLALY